MCFLDTIEATKLERLVRSRIVRIKREDSVLIHITPNFGPTADLVRVQIGDWQKTVNNREQLDTILTQKVTEFADAEICRLNRLCKEQWPIE